MGRTYLPIISHWGSMGTDTYNSIIAKKVFSRHAIGLLQLLGAATAYFYSKNNIIQYTYYSLAKAAGVSQSLIAKLEAGTIDSSYSKVRTIFDVLERLEFKTKVQAEKVLHNDVITVQKNEPISDVVKIMKENGISQVPVFDGKQSVGSISEKAILHQILAGQDLEEISRQPTEKIMEEAFPQINEDAPLSLITSLLQTYSAVLVSRKGDIIGIITKADLLRML
jgi:predicted transcriptional regulator